MPSEKLVQVYDSVTAIRVAEAPAELETALIPGMKLPLAEVIRRKLV